jgi:Zn-dependent membrane protease YugP
MDPLYLIFLIPAFLLAMWAQIKVKNTYSKFAQVPTMRGVNGLQAADTLMREYDINIGVNRIAGALTDHYDPRGKFIALSESSVQNSIASVAVVAHELGHAMQDKENYVPLKMRGAIVPAVQIGGWVAPLLLMAGMLLGMTQLMWLGVIGFGLTAFFAVITLPVEFNASSRAMKMLEQSNILAGDELKGARQVLDAAALTYVAAAAQAILTLLYYVMRLSGNSRRDE